MLTQKLNAHDPELRKDPVANENFDGTSVYAQNKRQQVVMTEIWAGEYSEVFFATMHPGWADTPVSQLYPWYQKSNMLSLSGRSVVDANIS